MRLYKKNIQYKMKMIFFWFQNRFEIIQQLKKKKRQKHGT